MSQNVTRRRNRDSISASQTLALERLLEGETVTAAAESAGVSRETVHRWIKSNWQFQARLNQAMQELQGAIMSRLLSAALRSSEVVSEAIDRGNLKAALAVLKGVGALRGVTLKVGITDPKVLEEESEIKSAKENFDRISRSIFP